MDFLSVIKRVNHTGLFVRTALLTALLIGGVIGLTSLLMPFTGWPIGAAHRFQHIHLQVWYFIGGFVLGAGFRIVPQLTGTAPPDDDLLPCLAGLLYVISALIWVFVQPFAFGDWSALQSVLVLASLIELAVWGVFVYYLLRSIVTARKEGIWKGVVGAGLLVILLSSASSAAGWSGWVGWMDVTDIRWTKHGYMGFLFVGVPLLAMGICGRAIRQKSDPDGAYVGGVVLISLGTLSFSGIVPFNVVTYAGVVSFLPGVALFGYGISFHRQFDRLNIPGFSHGVVVAFSFVLLFALLFTANKLTSFPLQNRAMVHVWAIGFLTVLIVAFGTWIFPAAAGRTPINSPSTVVAVYVLAGGTLIRVLAPALTSWIGGGGSVYHLMLLSGGLLQYAGIATFAVTLWPNLPPVVHTDETVRSERSGE